MLKYIFLGIIQGLTEFLPVSSSGHLVLLQRIMNINEQQLLNVIVLHLGTVIALIAFFFSDIIKLIKDLRLIFYIIIVTVITGFIALLGRDYFIKIFSSVHAVALSLFITGIILISTKRFLQHSRVIKDLTLKDIIFFGLAQGASVIPGISRSGITISTLLFRKISRDSAFRFSFLASIPAIIGAFIVEIRDLDFSSIEPGLVAGFISAFASGLFSLYLLKIILRNAKFFYFGYYCIIISVLSWIFLK